MVKFCGFFALIFFIVACSSGEKSYPTEIKLVDSLTLIPQVNLIEKREGFFTIDKSAEISYSNALQNEGDFLSNLINQVSNFELKQSIQKSASSNLIELKLVDEFPAELQHGEAYRILVSNEKLQISALTPVGIMRGIQTLRQLFVDDFNGVKKRDEWHLPALKIEDKPAFEHRGLMIDVCRHFFTKNVILKYIDALAFYKMNILHLHLTEDQGWRMPIDAYPNLNKVASYRIEKDGSVYGGFYTKDELKEIVAYAKERHIVVIPEIELPGHAQAALAAYPQYSCVGSDIEVANDWGVFKEIYCAGNDSTFVFIEQILKEVMEIFPSEYIHIGGDEAPKFRWQHCAKCQARMENEGLINEHELQSYFIRRIEKFLNQHDRKLIGWDEILEGGLSPNATVQSWRGFEGGIKAAQEKHYVVMSPTSHCYLDYGLDAIDLKKVFQFNPIPIELEKEFHKYILGAECNMWTEHVPDEASLDAKVFPRAVALAEVLWANPPKDRYEDFYARLQKHYPVLKLIGINFGAEMIPVKITTHVEDEEVFIDLISGHKDLVLKYRWHCDSCGTEFKNYEKKIALNESGKLEVQAFKNGEKYGEPILQEIILHRALFSPAVYNQPLNEYYPAAGQHALTDGKLGSLNFRDGNWQGFWGKDLQVTLDLGEKQFISKITTNFVEYSNAWIMRPSRFRIYFSLDNLNWNEINKISVLPINAAVIDGISINPFVITFNTIETMYLRFEVKNYGKLPPSHEAAGQDTWLFIDEISIE